MNKKYAIIFIIICIIVSCKNKKNTKEQFEDEIKSRIENLDEKNDTDDSIPSASILKLNDSTYILDNDTFVVSKPFIYSFDGILNNKRVQIHLSNKVISEYGPYLVSGIIYIDGNEDSYYFDYYDKDINKMTTISKYTYAGEDEIIGKIKINNIHQTNMSIELILNNKRCVLKPSKFMPSYKCYDRIEHILYNVPAENNKWRSYSSQSRDYDFLAEIKSNNSWFNNFVSKQKYLFTDSADLVNYKSWKNNFAIETANNEDESYSYESMSYVVPIYVDSFLYVCRQFTHVYMGGAHGMPTTDYLNYDVQTGELIKLDDILDIDDPAFYKLYIDELKNANESFGLSDDVPVSQNFYLMPQGITFSYYPYEIAGFAAGEPSVFINYKDIYQFVKAGSFLNKYLK